MDNIIIIYILLIVLLVGFYFFYLNRIKKQNEELRENIKSGEFIYYKDFEKDWISAKLGRKGVAGYKYNDTPGCYVITIYNTPVLQDYMEYENIYIGQSVNVCKRVHNHFNGKGNGDIYADIKYGKFVYVRIVPCHEEEMNTLEKQLIRAFNATSSYNRTRGGGRRRY